MRVTVLAGGIGAARFLAGLQRVVRPESITAVCNVGDDLDWLGLKVCPDIDSVLYTLAGVEGAEGWGVRGDTRHALDALRALGGETWFSVGDADFNTVWFTDLSKRNYWSNAEFNRLWLEARSTFDEGERLRIYRRMMQIMHDEVPAVFMFGLPRISGRSAKVTGWRPSRDSLLRLRQVSVK